MSTFVYDLAYSIEDRWLEVDILIAKAAFEETLDFAFYDALCRATVVLIVAHLEGFMKDAGRAIIQDINKFSSFNRCPAPIKRTFCKSFIELPMGEFKSGAEHRLLRLINMLDNLDTKLSVEPFLIENNYGNNKNPSPGIIDRICSNFGVEKVFLWTHNSKLDIVFSGTQSDVLELISELRNHILASTAIHPYTLDPFLFGVQEVKNAKSSTPSFWETFLDQVLKYRHDVAHGSSFTNSLSVRELVDFRNKVVVLQYTLLLILSAKSLPRL